MPKIAQLANRVFNVEADPCNPKEVGQEGINRFRIWLSGLGMPQTLSELLERDITDEIIDEILDDVHFNSKGIMSGFGHCTKEDVRNLYLSIR